MCNKINSSVVIYNLSNRMIEYRGGSGTGDTGDWTPIDFQQGVTVTRPELTQWQMHQKYT